MFTLSVLVAVGGTHLFLFLKMETHPSNGTLNPGLLDIVLLVFYLKISCLLVMCLIVVTRTPGDSHLQMKGVAPSLGKVWQQQCEELVTLCPLSRDKCLYSAAFVLGSGQSTAMGSCCPHIGWLVSQLSFTLIGRDVSLRRS